MSDAPITNVSVTDHSSGHSSFRFDLLQSQSNIHWYFQQKGKRGCFRDHLSKTNFIFED